MEVKAPIDSKSATTLMIATVVTLVLYLPQAYLLLSKIGEVFGGVFDTAVPAFPLAGMLFALMFIVLRRNEFFDMIAVGRRSIRVTALGALMMVVPLPLASLFASLLQGSYVYAAIALATCWVGAMTVLRPSVFRFLLPYLVSYILAIGSVSVLTVLVGDPLAIVVASASSWITSLLGLPVHWSSIFISFTAAGGTQVELYISQECSGVASISIFILLIALMHIDLRRSTKKATAIAVGGSALFILLNAARVVAIIAGGIYGGVDLMWSLHGWVGYAFYILGYAILIMLYVGRSIPVESKKVRLG